MKSVFEIARYGHEAPCGYKYGIQRILGYLAWLTNSHNSLITLRGLSFQIQLLL